MRLNISKQEKALVRLDSHQALNTDRQCRSVWCGFNYLVRFWVRFRPLRRVIGKIFAHPLGAVFFGGEFV